MNTSRIKPWKNCFVNLKRELFQIRGKIERTNLKIQELQYKIHSQENGFKKLELLSDDNEQQYSRRSCLRNHGIEFKEGDGGEVMEEIEKR